MSTECRIRCRARRGQFADEMLVRINAVAPDGGVTEVTSLAYAGSVETESRPDRTGECDALVRAQSLGQKDDLVAVVLPQPTFQNGANVVVRRRDVVHDGKAQR